ncbi:RNA-directed DNA polymerase, eukaryota, reverse transcriptase zinc-binding domain protein [Tanacetum coccineum]|uniref:RNA-directed DNA polymerase, eukaryota, reverse transcriptase zinc-binding domain protein n=1 Tax=Tanacetum coccineum TaxID=301880 RepID=A0ABQ5AAC1_9ASTR
MAALTRLVKLTSTISDLFVTRSLSTMTRGVSEIQSSANLSDGKGPGSRNFQWVFLGKGTYASRLCNLLGFSHVAIGDLVWHELACKGPLFIQLAAIVNKGKIYDVNSFALEIGCQHSQLPFIYLGLPVGANMSRCTHWSPLVERFRNRLSKWKCKTLSYGGRLTLIKSVLGSLGVYFFSTFKAPITIINNLERIRRTFFWGGNLEERKIAWVAWEKVIAPLDQGGLNIEICLVRDRAPQPTVDTNLPGPPVNGTLLLFGLHFPCAWARPIRSAAKHQEFNELVTLLTNLRLSNDHDCWECTISSNRLFTVKSMRSHIRKILYPLNPQPFRWNKALPSKINISSWKILHKRLPTRFNLDRRGVGLDSTRCPVCDEDIETEEHLFTSCFIATETWRRVFTWWKI